MKKVRFKNYFSTFVPQSVLMLKGYNGSKFIKDLLAGLIVGIIALPLSIALAIASGAPPEVGLITAVVAGLFGSLFAGSPFQITGPTGAFVIIVLNIINNYTYEGMLIATFMAGVILVIMGFLKMGKIVNYIAKPIIIGFTTGIAVTIFSTQIVDFFSLKIAENPSSFIDKMVVYSKALNTTNYAALCIGAGALIFMLVWNRFKLKTPSALIAVILSALIVSIFKIDIPTIGTKLGELHMKFNFNIPFGGISIAPLLKPAITIALLAAIESLLSAMAADSMSKTKTNYDMELVSQGLANIASSCFGGLPATGAIARTSANIKNGGVTPIAGIIHALFLLIVGLVLMPLVKYIPLTTLAAVLFVVCINMVDVKAIKKVFKSNVSDILLFLTTFVLTVIFDLVVAIVAGVILSFVLFFVRMLIKKIKFKTNRIDINVEDNKIILSGMLNFINANTFNNKIANAENIDTLNELQSIVIDTSQLHTVDMSGKEAINNLKDYYENQEKSVALI